MPSRKHQPPERNQSAFVHTLSQAIEGGLLALQSASPLNPYEAASAPIARFCSHLQAKKKRDEQPMTRIPIAVTYVLIHESSSYRSLDYASPDPNYPSTPLTMSSVLPEPDGSEWADAISFSLLFTNGYASPPILDSYARAFQPSRQHPASHCLSKGSGGRRSQSHQARVAVPTRSWVQ